MRSADIAWAAGLFEGEGCFSLGERNVRVILGMTDKDIVERFRDVIGFGKIDIRFPYKNAKKLVYKWRIDSFEGFQYVVCFFWKYLGERRKEKAANILRYLRTRREAMTVGQKAFYVSWHKTRRLNKALATMPQAPGGQPGVPPPQAPAQAAPPGQ